MPYQPKQLIFNRKYRIESLVGEGAFGEVYLATNLALNVQRALKVLRRNAPGIGSTQFSDYRRRFQFEAQLGAQLNSPATNPHLLQVHSYEEKGQALLLEMEYAPGGSLAERLAGLKKEAGSMPVEAVVQIGLEVAQGLSALHERDIVHRDLKPSNILFDQAGHARVSDLGLAQVHSSDSLRSQVSNPPPHPGTPAYMSPEQETFRTYLSPASDVYALGLVLFEALTGRIYKNLRPGTHPATLRPDVPAWLDDLLTRMLSEDPKLRPWDGNEAGTFLMEGLLSGGPGHKPVATQPEKPVLREAGEPLRKDAETRPDQVAPEPALRLAKVVRSRAETPAHRGTSRASNTKAWMAVLVGGIVLVLCLLAGGWYLLTRMDTASRTDPPVVPTATHPAPRPFEPAASTAVSQPTYTFLPTYTLQPAVVQDLEDQWTISLTVTGVVPGDGVTNGCPSTDRVIYEFTIYQDYSDILSGTYFMQDLQNLGSDQYPFSGTANGSQFSITSSITSGECNGNINLWQGSISGAQMTGSKSIVQKGQGYCCTYTGPFTGVRK